MTSTDSRPSSSQPSRKLIAEGFRLHSAGKLDQATQIYRQVLAREPDNFDALNLAGTAALQTGDNHTAATLLSQALTGGKQQGNPREQRERRCDALANHATALQNLRQFDAALVSARKALTIRPTDAVLLANTGSLLKELGQFDEAEALLRKSLALNKRNAGAWARLAQLMIIAGRRADAMDAASTALQLEPRNPTFMVLKGTLLIERGEPETALQMFNDALQIDPDYSDARYNRAVLWVTQGKFTQGWPEYFRHHPGSRDLLKTQLPLPKQLHGMHLYVRRSQGLGDELFFLRFVPLLKARGARISYHSDPRLFSMIGRTGLMDAMTSSDTPPADANGIMTVDLLPYFLEAGDQDIPPSLKLAPTMESIQRMALRLAQAGPPPYLGVTWRAGRLTAEIDYRDVVTTVLVKHIDPALLGTALRDWPGTILILQRQPDAAELQQFTQAVGKAAVDFSDVNDQLEDMLAVLSMIERYATVSNTNLHLRAAAGLPSHVLVPHPPELRWGLTGRSVWFPDCPVYRQAADGQWPTLTTQLLAELTR